MEFALLAAGLVIGVVLGWLAASRRATAPVPQPGPDPVLELQHERALLEARAESERALSELALRETGRRAELEARVAEAEASERGLREALAAAQEQYRALVERNRIEQAERERAAGDESKVLQSLAPVAQQIQTMQAKVDELEKQRSAQHSELAEQIRATRQAAAESHRTATTLATALRNNAVRGSWGETSLSTLLESSGLLPHVDLESQLTLRSSEGTGRPDYVVRLPGGMAVPIDSKVPYSAYIDAQNEESDPDRRSSLLTEHAKTVRGHVDQLSRRNYPKLLVDDGASGYTDATDFTIAFIPSDTILDAALRVDPSLFDYAFGKNVVLATPASLWTILKGFASMWRQNEVAETAAELNAVARELYSRLVTMAEPIAKLGRSLTTSVNDYNKFVGSLERNVLPQGRKLEKLDATKMLPDLGAVEIAPRALAAPEFAALAELDDVERPELDLGLALGGTSGSEEILGDSGAA